MHLKLVNKCIFVFLTLFGSVNVYAEEDKISIFNILTGQIVALQHTESIGVELKAYSGYYNGVLGTSSSVFGVYYKISNQTPVIKFILDNTGGCLSSGADGYDDRIKTEVCRENNKAQDWDLIYSSSGAIQLKNISKNQCLQVSELKSSSSSLRLRNCQKNNIDMRQLWIIGAPRTMSNVG